MQRTDNGQRTTESSASLFSELNDRFPNAGNALGYRQIERLVCKFEDALIVRI